MKYFFKRYTKWVLVDFIYLSDAHMVLTYVRKNLKTNSIMFKTKTIQSVFLSNETINLIKENICVNKIIKELF
jgi:hypothetical protein